MAVQALREGRNDDCLAALDRLAAVVGPNSAVLQVRALALQALGQVDAALCAFRDAIALQPHPVDPYLLANAAALLETLRHDAEAIDHYNQAAAIAPQLIDVQMARLTAIRRIKGDAAAREAFSAIILANPQSSELHHYHALFLRDCGDTAGALAATVRVLAIRPDSQSARQLAARIKLDARIANPTEFTELGDDEDIIMGAAAAWVQRNNVPNALKLLDEALSRHPEWYNALQTRLSISQQMQSFDTAANWLRQFSDRHGSPADLKRALGNLIWRGCGSEAALAEIGPLGRSNDDPVSDQLLRADLLSEAGRSAEADDAWSRIAPHLATLPPHVQTGQVRHLFRSGKIEQATQLAYDLARQSGLVEAWAYVELGWRITGDPRHVWLVGGDTLVAQRPLDRFGDYQEALTSALRDLHSSIAHHPLEQSPRNGTQTDGPLFSLDTPEIQSLVRDIRAGVAAYLAAIPDLGREHPMDRLRKRNFRFSGSWSIRLSQQGFHTPHFHNDGLVSSACHISLPPCVTARSSDNRQSGWLELGRPPASLGLDVEPIKILEPREGVLALFPSFLFHGTRPFDEGERLTVAFDVAAIAA